MSDEQPQKAAPVLNPTNPLLNKIRIPPEVHRLPSQGLLYQDGELDSSVSNGEVKIYPFTVEDELELKSPDLLFSGDAIVSILNRRVPQISHPLEMYARDIDFIMLVLRKASYGTSYEIKYKHTCEAAKEHSYMADLDHIIKQSKAIDSMKISDVYNLSLPNGQTVSFRPMRLKHLIMLMQTTDKDLPIEDQKRLVYDAMMMLIHDVDGITAPEMIKEWIQNINPLWVKDIRKKIEETSQWGPEFKHQATCKDCGEAITLDINTNPLVFFT